MSGLVSYSSDSEDESEEQIATPSVATIATVEVKPTGSDAPNHTNGRLSPRQTLQSFHPKGPLVSDTHEHHTADFQSQFETLVPQIATNPPLSGPVLGPDAAEAEGYNHLPEPEELDYPVSIQERRQNATALPFMNRNIVPPPEGAPADREAFFFEKLAQKRDRGLHFHPYLVDSKAFRNPAWLQLQTQLSGITFEDQYSTSLPHSVYDHRPFPGYVEKWRQEMLAEKKKRQEATMAKVAQVVPPAENYEARRKQEGAIGRPRQFVAAEATQEEKKRSNQMKDEGGGQVGHRYVDGSNGGMTNMESTMIQRSSSTNGYFWLPSRFSQLDNNADKPQQEALDISAVYVASLASTAESALPFTRLYFVCLPLILGLDDQPSWFGTKEVMCHHKKALLMKSLAYGMHTVICRLCLTKVNCRCGGVISHCAKVHFIFAMEAIACVVCGIFTGYKLNEESVTA